MTDTRMFFAVWDKDRRPIFGQQVDTVAEAEQLAQEWTAKPEADRVILEWQRGRERKGPRA